ncbi:hypothetical protein FDI69_gp184 [Rhodococcus phage Trina]|uniref:Uncharacterized protein n=1 Tax=Rhodococcus phage Trina TaxID=2027905 RepID=A0A2D1A2G4_9CAUD|nr:hypothetical protein FDI69_gp184 [Rhodococcus phage Trina]ASZ75002.1 hypothetical protein SEA_TRINA_223 [Rhodococcus phage Trina]
MIGDTTYNIIRQALESVQSPVRGMAIDIIDYDGAMYVYCIYQDNLSDKSDADQQRFAEWLIERAEIATKLSGVTVSIEKRESMEAPNE